MSVHRKGPSQWVYRWREYDPLKKRTVNKSSAIYARKNLAQLAESNADEIRARAQVELRARRRIGGAKAFSVVLERWEASRLATGKAQEGYTSEVAAILRKLAQTRRWVSVEDITADRVDQWLADGGSERVLDYLKSVLNYAYRIMRQPVDPHVLLATVERMDDDDGSPEAVLTDAHVATILAAADAFGERVGTLIRHLALYGQRPRAVVNITVGNYDEVGRILTIPKKYNKNKRGIQHPVDDAEHAARLSRLCTGRAPGEPLFVDLAGLPWYSGEHRKAAKLSVWYRRNVAKTLPTGHKGIYLLKDYAVSGMRQAGFDGAAICSYTGQRTRAVIDLYDKTTRERMREVWTRKKALPIAAEPGNQPGNASPEKPTGTDSGTDQTLPPSM